MLSLISFEEAHEGGKNFVSFFVGLMFFNGCLFIYNKKLEKNLDSFNRLWGKIYMQWHADILSIEFCESWQYLESCHLHKHKGKAFPSLQKSGSLGMLFENFPNGTLVESAWSGRSIGKRNGKPLLFCLGNLMDRGAWWAIVHGVAKSQTRLSD